MLAADAALMEFNGILVPSYDSGLVFGALDEVICGPRNDLTLDARPWLEVPQNASSTYPCAREASAAPAAYLRRRKTELAEGDRVHRFRHSPTGGRNSAAAPGDEAVAPPSRKRGVKLPIRGRPRLPGMTS